MVTRKEKKPKNIEALPVFTFVDQSAYLNGSCQSDMFSNKSIWQSSIVCTSAELPRDANFYRKMSVLRRSQAKMYFEYILFMLAYVMLLNIC